MGLERENPQTAATTAATTAVFDTVETAANEPVAARSTARPRENASNIPNAKGILPLEKPSAFLAVPTDSPSDPNVPAPAVFLGTYSWSPPSLVSRRQATSCKLPSPQATARAAARTGFRVGAVGARQRQTPGATRTPVGARTRGSTWITESSCFLVPSARRPTGSILRRCVPPRPPVSAERGRHKPLLPVIGIRWRAEGPYTDSWPPVVAFFPRVVRSSCSAPAPRPTWHSCGWTHAANQALPLLAK